MAQGPQRDPRREAYWRDVVARQEQSGLSVRTFCQRQRLAETALYAWRRTIRQRDGERERSRRGKAAPAAAAFVPVVVDSRQRPQAVGDDCIRIELRGGRVLHLPLCMLAEQLAAVVGAIESQAREGA